MNYWNRQAKRLENLLAGNNTVLVQHFLRTAPSDLIAEFAGTEFTDASEKTLASIAKTLAAQHSK